MIGWLANHRESLRRRPPRQSDERPVDAPIRWVALPRVEYRQRAATSGRKSPRLREDRARCFGTARCRRRASAFPNTLRERAGLVSRAQARHIRGRGRERRVPSRDASRACNVIGRGLFDVLPDDAEAADGLRNLRESLERVQTTKRADVMAVQHYPVRRPASEGGGLEQRWWSPVNSPVRGLLGDLDYIIHRVEDVTPFIERMRSEGHEREAMAMLETRAQHMEA